MPVRASPPPSPLYPGLSISAGLKRRGAWLLERERPAFFVSNRRVAGSWVEWSPRASRRQGWNGPLPRSTDHPIAVAGLGGYIVSCPFGDVLPLEPYKREPDVHGEPPFGVGGVEPLHRYKAASTLLDDCHDEGGNLIDYGKAVNLENGHAVDLAGFDFDIGKSRLNDGRAKAPWLNRRRQRSGRWTRPSRLRR